MNRLAGLLIALVLAVTGLTVATSATAEASPVCRSGMSCGKVCVTKKSKVGVQVSDHWNTWRGIGASGRWYAVAPGHCSDEKVHDADSLHIFPRWHAIQVGRPVGKGSPRPVCFQPGNHRIRDADKITISVRKGSKCPPSTRVRR